MPLGDHRDEPWQLVVEPRPELEHRCTLIAIRKLVETALTLDRYRRDEKQRAALWPADTLDGDPESVWVSEQMTEVLSVARRIAPTPLSVLLTGETGTGKEMLARAIHRASDRADRPFVPFNCTAVPRDMLESQLFGYRKGAFTGADSVVRRRDPRRRRRHALPRRDRRDRPRRPAQAAALPRDPRDPPARRAAAGQGRRPRHRRHQRRPRTLVADGRFREDLFYRLNVVRLKLPPLRERREEIPPLIDHYLRKFADEQKKGRLTLDDETLEYLLLYAWPGNVRQLANEIRRMVALADADATLTPALLSPEIQASRRTIRRPPPRRTRRSASASISRSTTPSSSLEQTMVTRAARAGAGARRERRAAARHLAEGPVPEAPALGPPAGVIRRTPPLRPSTASFACALCRIMWAVAHSPI